MNTLTITLGLVVTFFSTIVPFTLAEAAWRTVEPNSGFIDQEEPDWIEADPIIPKRYPSLIEQVRAANLLVHQMDRLEIGAPTYAQAHRLLLQNLLQMQRQLNFNPEVLAVFQATTHPARSTVDQRIYTRNTDEFGEELYPEVVQAPYPYYTPTYLPSTATYDIPTRRSIMLAAEEYRLDQKR